MGKVKSAIITALLSAAIIVLALFATISCDVPGSNGVSRYNSFMTSIPLGSELTGDASAVIYADGVITESRYNRDVYDNADKLEEYGKKYTKKNGFYIDNDKLGEDDGAALAAAVKKDAEILSDRFSEKGYSSYTVSVVNGYAIRITVPSGLSYAAYKGHDNTSRSQRLSNEIGHTVSSLMMSGGIDLRDGTTYEDSQSLIPFKDSKNVNAYFKGASLYGAGGTYAVKVDLTDLGFENFNKILTGDSEAETLYLYIGETNLQLSFSMGTALSEKSMFFQADKSYAQDYAIILSSVIGGNQLENAYKTETENGTGGSTLVVLTPAYGENSAIWFAVLVLVVLLAAIIIPIIKYKKLGIVNALMVLTYAVAMVTALVIIGIELTVAGIFSALVGLAALVFSNFFTFEAVRRETALGKTISSSVKLGYKKSLFGILDMHVVLIVAAVIMTLVGAGELSACGLIFLIGSIASFVLYWFTRFMWYVISSFVRERDRFAFCGFAREEVEDDD